MAEEKETEQSEAPSGGYGAKGNGMKWVIIYLIAAVIIYGAYYLFAIKSSDGGSGTSTESLYGN